MTPDEIQFYRNPTPYDIIKYQDQICWDQLSLLIERDLTSKEIRMFCDNINLASYLIKHDISDDDFKYLSDHGKIDFIDRYRLTHKSDRITDDNIKMICGDYNSLWAQSFMYNDISEDVLIENFNIISPHTSDFKKIAKEKMIGDDRYSRLLLLLELND